MLSFTSVFVLSFMFAFDFLFVGMIYVELHFFLHRIQRTQLYLLKIKFISTVLCHKSNAHVVVICFSNSFLLWSANIMEQKDIRGTYRPKMSHI